MKDRRDLIVKILNQYDFGPMSEDELYAAKRETFDSLNGLTNAELTVKLAEVGQFRLGLGLKAQS